MKKLFIFVIFATSSFSQWQIMVVDSGEILASTSITLDALEYPHISYSDTIGVKYTKWNGLGWEIQRIDSFGIGTSICVDTSKFPHISYNCFYPDSTYPKSHKLKYAQWTGSSWSIQIIENEGVGIDVPIGLKLNKNGYPCIVYSKTCCKYATFNGFFWTVENVDTSVEVSLALDKNNIPHVSGTEIRQLSRDTSINYLKYNYKPDSVWKIIKVDSIKFISMGINPIYPTSSTSIVVDESNQVHICYTIDTFPIYIKYAKIKNDSLLEIDTIDINWETYSSLSIGVDKNYKVHVSYCIFDNPFFYLKYGNKIGGSNWIIETVDSGVNPIVGSSMDLDNKGFPYISYVEWKSNNNVLKYAAKIHGIKQNKIILEGFIYVEKNTFNEKIKFHYYLPKKCKINLNIYNLTGELIKALVDDTQNEGNYSIYWSGEDKESKTVSNGIYFVCLFINNKKICSQKVILIK